jgi:hypothetical protein
MTEKQQQRYIIDDNMLMTWRAGCINPFDPCHDTPDCRMCEYRGKGAREKCCDFDDDDMQKIFQSNPVGNFIHLTPTLITHYQQRSQDTGKTVQQLVLADFTALMKKRTAREEKRVWKDIEYGRL